MEDLVAEARRPTKLLRDAHRVAVQFVAQVAPQRRARREQYDVSRRNQLLGNIKDELSSVESNAKTLKDEKLYQSRTTSVSDETVGTAKVESGAALGSYKFEFFQPKLLHLMLHPLQFFPQMKQNYSHYRNQF